MTTVNMLEAKTQLSKRVEAVESGAEAEIIIARNGKPAARIVPIAQKRLEPRRLGGLDGMYPSISLEEFNAMDEEIARAPDLPAIATPSSPGSPAVQAFLS